MTSLLAGYRLQSDGKACADVDECAETPWVCSQFCDNTVGGYYCACGNGYVREADGKTCRQISTIEPYLLFSNRCIIIYLLYKIFFIFFKALVKCIALNTKAYYES